MYHRYHRYKSHRYHGYYNCHRYPRYCRYHMYYRIIGTSPIGTAGILDNYHRHAHHLDLC